MMVSVNGSRDSQIDKLDAYQIALAGAASGLLTRALSQPFDVLKIRFQLQVEPIRHGTNSKYTSMLQAVSLIYREEGIKAFWKGHVPAQLLSISFGLIQFWTFETIIKEARRADLYEHKIVVNFLSGAAAGSAATVLSFPFDILRTRLIAQCPEKGVYKGVISGFQHLVKTEGFLALFNGLKPTVVSIGPNIGTQFMFYNFFNDIIYKRLKFDDQFNIFASLVSGSLAGLCSKMITYPFDLTRKRLQIQGFQKYRSKQFGSDFVCIGMTQCFQKVYKYEGPQGLFKGMSPSLIKAFVTSALNFTIYGFLCNFFIHLSSL